MISTALLQKYDIPAPRYTSYPTVPYWSDSPTTDQWIESVRSALQSEESSWSIYLHLPFCETLCSFCGCNTSITKDHSKEEQYLNLILREFNTYKSLVPNFHNRPLRQLHLGGGTPTFFSAAHLKLMVESILSGLEKGSPFEGSIEVDPRRTKEDQLVVLRELGFQRVSMGVQDFNPEVQRLINRVQPIEMTAKLTEQARNLGYESINYDLIYGLPKQTLKSIEEMAKLTVELKPDRIALYSMALVPWIKPAQRLFKDDDLPKGAEKRALYELARNILTSSGYIEIGMDHFALATDALYKAMKNEKLHRNFMGYTDVRTDVLLGLGVSSISESPTCFHQNEKALPVYEREVSQGKIPTLRGHKLSESDRLHREQILQFMTRGRVKLLDQRQIEDVKGFLSELIADGLVEFDGLEMRITPLGKPFLRNACMALDERLRQKSPDTRVFSQAL